MTTGAGLYDIPHRVYHADAHGTGLTFTSSCARILLTRSPRHAHQAHPHLGGGLHEEPSEAMERGEIIHHLVLGGGRDIVAVDADDWRTKAAREARDSAREAGKVPILRYRLTECEEAARLISMGVLWSPDARTEVSAYWESEGGVACRARMDVLELDFGLHRARILDLKSCENAQARSAPANMFREGMDIQAAAYIEAIETIHPELAGRVGFEWVFAEVRPPYGTIRAIPDGEMLALGRSRWRRAVRAWGACLRTKQWPTYPHDPVRVSPPAWAIAEDTLIEQDERARAAREAAEREANNGDPLPF